ncbi:hypothetical protein KIPB_010071 [Kipferlia bialata]|uniref:Uncharacterized protein n=1 Tax=Kipferlia bialata TaxID=797122 RepID=A0A391NPB1_9EUKA|nr:hypothetical protein KIPB_010071 [Kipferlia bialata]|eukprot:g10071.t1
MSPFNTWEWSLVTRRLTHTGNCPRSLEYSTGTVVSDIYHVYPTPHPWHLQYFNGEWHVEPDPWDPFRGTVSRDYRQRGVPLLRHQTLEITECSEDDYFQPPMCWLRDYVSLDRVPLEPLPLSPSDRGEVAVECMVLLDPTTLLLVHSTCTLLVDIDPHFLSPVCHTSMVGSGAWVEE